MHGWQLDVLDRCDEYCSRILQLYAAPRREPVEGVGLVGRHVAHLFLFYPGSTSPDKPFGG